jgi:hypothetical protein
MKQTDMFEDELKESRMKVIMGKMKFWGKKTQTAAKEMAESEAAREIGTAAKETTVEAIKSEPMKFATGGALCGAIIGLLGVVPFVGVAAGMTAGATLGIYKWFTK